MLSVVTHLRLGTPWGVVAMNLLMLAVGLAVVYRLCRQPLGLTSTRAALVCMALLLAHTFSQLVPSPMSDVSYFAVAMVCLLVLTTAERRSGLSRVGLLLLAAVLAAAGISIRIEGLALVPPVLFVAVGAPRVAVLWRAARRHPTAGLAILAPSLLLLAAVAVVVVRATPYGQQFAHGWRTNAGLGPFLARVIFEARHKLASVGELAAQTRDLPALAVLGIFVLVLVVLGWLARRRIGAIEAFVISTAAVILVYVNAVDRYWMAALPFLIVYALFGAERLARFRPVKAAFALYAIAFTVAGGAALINSVAISTSGRRFPRAFASQTQPRLAATYRVAFGEARPGDDLKVIPAALELLRRYEPLARPRLREGRPAFRH